MKVFLVSTKWVFGRPFYFGLFRSFLLFYTRVTSSWTSIPNTPGSTFSLPLFLHPSPHEPLPTRLCKGHKNLYSI